MSISQESSLVLLTFKSRGLIGNYQPELSSRHFHVTQCLTVTENCALSLQHVVQNIKPHKKYTRQNDRQRTSKSLLQIMVSIGVKMVECF